MNWHNETNPQTPAIRRMTREHSDRQNTIQKWALDPAWQNATYGAMFCLGVGTAVSGAILLNLGYLFGLIFVMLGSPMFGYGAWGSWTLSKRLNSYAPTALLEEQEEVNQVIEPPTPNESMVRWSLLDGRYIEFMQPEPGEFVKFATLAMNEDNGITLSQNKASERGWPSKMHKAMMAILSDVGIVYQGKNQAPVITAKGKKELMAYTKMLSPHPNGR